MKLILFTGPECHLCELAQQQIDSLARDDIELTKVNIRDNATYYHLYAMKIPVLKRQDNEQELNWPFDGQSLLQFIQ